MASLSEYSFELLSPPMPPVPAEEVLACLSREMGDPWLPDIRTRLGDPSARSRNLFSVGRDGTGRVVSNAWVGWNGGQPEGQRVGLLGHVVTLPEHRRRGLATQVTRLAMEAFYKEGGLCLLLGASNQSAVRIYEQLGFLVARGGPEAGETIMLHSRHSIAPDAFLGWYFSGTGPVTTEATTRHHVGDIALLLLSADGQPISAGPLVLGDPLSAERDALNLFRLLEGVVTSRVALVRSRVVGLEIELSGNKYSIYSNSYKPKQS